MDYDYSSSAAMDPVATILLSIIYLALLVAMIAAMWVIFEKAGEHGWAAIVPLYNGYVLFKVAGYSGWMFLLMFIPVINFVVGIMMALELGRRFGKSGVWSFFLLFVLSVIGYLMLAFGDNTYQKRSAAVGA
ncbi:MAG TPA: DUF5684 domain-containing protein [Propionicimonas sp.]|jgi:Family of unknown function (DUF5684)|nr:DUF5684 domain-containing protein [Propionicimonas sp.]